MTPADLVARALSVVDTATYELGTGNYDPRNPDDPETVHHQTKKRGCDCAGFAVCWVHKLRRHRPGFGRGPGTHVTDDINSDSTLFDARYNHELFTLVEGPPLPGDLLIKPSIYHVDGTRLGIGHVWLTVANRALEWDHAVLPRPWEMVDVVQCRGPNGKRPGIIKSTAKACADHDAKWVKVPSMWIQVVRMRPEVLEKIV